MAIDGKYGHVTFEHAPHTPIPDDEPVFILRAQDEVAPDAVEDYAYTSRDRGSPESHVNAVLAAAADMRAWQLNNSDRVKVPD